MAQQTFGKTDARYWRDAIFKRRYVRNGQTLHVEDWTARIQWRGRRELFSLKTPNKAAAAAKAPHVKCRKRNFGQLVPRFRITE